MNARDRLQLNAGRHHVCARFRGRAFTLVELLVVIAILGILVALLLPVLDKGKLKAQGIQCLSNHRQLTMAWKMYVDDNDDYLPFASRNWSFPHLDQYGWVLGDMDSSTNRANWDPDYSIKKGVIWPYCGGSVGIWKCPADHSGVMIDGEWKPRVRSMSMNIWVGGFNGYSGGLSGNDHWTRGGSYWRVYLKFSQLNNPGPSQIFLLMDMREDSIDWGNYATDMRGWPDNPEQARFYDLPASYHHRAGGISFADGHAETKRWRDPRTMPPLVPNGQVHDEFASPNNSDIIWLQFHSTRPR